VRAREAASLLLGTLDHGDYVGRFLRNYANDYDRAGLLEQPALYRDLSTSIRREALLAMAVHLDAAIPGKLGVTAAGDKAPRPSTSQTRRGKKARVKSPQTSAAERRRHEEREANVNVFREEFFVALGQALNWREEDFREFSRDFDLYQRIGLRRGSTTRSPANVAEGPFVDRCGLLLDSSMLDQARRVAGRFEGQLHSIADQVIKRVFATRREN